jgi:hypothetical protein
VQQQAAAPAFNSSLPSVQVQKGWTMKKVGRFLLDGMGEVFARAQYVFMFALMRPLSAYTDERGTTWLHFEGMERSAWVRQTDTAFIIGRQRGDVASGCDLEEVARIDKRRSDYEPLEATYHRKEAQLTILAFVLSLLVAFAFGLAVLSAGGK